ncbi:MAG: HAD family hydrolase [Pseudonocardiaceae bacterium]|uniref:HAD family hydrolase n=1 Tax=Pseudomonas sp. TaxID=306 RepID=UPI003D6EE59B
MSENERPKVDALILDMDNTLYDWVAFFVPALYAMAEVVGKLLHVPTELVLRELREVHRTYGNTEHPFALLETRLVQSAFPRATRQEAHDALQPAFRAFNKERATRLRLYPEVASTLATVRAAGCRVFGHTEATVVNIEYRLQKLKIADFFDKVFASKWNGLSHPQGRDSKGSGQRVLVLPTVARKPDPEALRVLLNEIHAVPSRTLYVGDSLSRDVQMANQAGVLAAWAKYGSSNQKELWEKLVHVSHWAGESVAAVDSERSGHVPLKLKYRSITRFGQLLEEYVFTAHNGEPNATT